MKTFKNYPNKNIKPHVKGLEYLNVTTELADKIASDFDVYVMVDEYDRNFLLVDLGNDYAIEFEINEYRKNKFIFMVEYFSFVEVRELFNYRGNDTYTYSKNAFKKRLDFYTNAFNEMVKYEEIAKVEMFKKHNDLLNKGFLYIPGSFENKDYFHFGLYYYQSAKFKPCVSVVNGVSIFNLNIDWYNKETRICETTLFKENLENNIITSHLEIERIYNTEDEFNISSLSLIKYDICLNIMRSINFNYDLNSVWGIKFVYINKYNSYFIYNNEKYSDTQLIQNLDVSTLLEIRKALLHILKMNEPKFEI